MESPVRYQVFSSVAHVTMDDGKVNVLSLPMQAALHGALDRAEGDGAAAVLLAGRPGVFSAGFDLATLRAGGTGARDMVIGGFELAERTLSFPSPVVIACTGHAIAMGVFLLLSGDYRIGADGPWKLQANEVAIGLTMPRAAVEILRQRLTPGALTRAVTLSEAFRPADAVAAGFLDDVVPEADLVTRAVELADRATALDGRAHRASKLRMRHQTLDVLRSAIEADRADFDGQL
jgi:enoyl-CoA hydratase